MKRSTRIKYNFIRNWHFPGKERMANLFRKLSDLQPVSNGITWLTNEDIAIYASTNSYIEYTILSTGTYEDEIGKLIRTSLKEGCVALDIGANIGLQSIRMSQCCGSNGRVYAFEPLNYLQKKFNKNIDLNRCTNITLFPFALADKADERPISITETDWNQGTFNIHQANSGTSAQTLTIKVADEIEELMNAERIDLIKIDVEGLEYQVLRGLHRLIKKHHPRIIFEYDSNYWLKAGQGVNECYGFLSSLNYSLYQITQIGCELIVNPAFIEGGNIFCMPILHEQQ